MIYLSGNEIVLMTFLLICAGALFLAYLFDRDDVYWEEYDD